MIALIDETTPQDSKGVFYVVTAAICIEQEDIAREAVASVTGQRTKPFHWATEGPVARRAMADTSTHSPS